MSVISYIYRSVKLPAVTKALEKKKLKSSTAASPLHEDPVTINDDKNVEEGKPVIVKDTAKLTSSKELSINLEVMTLKPAVKTVPKRQMAVCLHFWLSQSPVCVLSLHGLRSGKSHTGGTEAPRPSAHLSNLYPSCSRRYLPLLKSLWQPPEASDGGSL